MDIWSLRPDHVSRVGHGSCCFGDIGCPFPVRLDIWPSHHKQQTARNYLRVPCVSRVTSFFDITRACRRSEGPSVGSRGPGFEDPEGTRPSPEGAGRSLRHGGPAPPAGGAIFPGNGRGHRSVPELRRVPDPRGRRAGVAFASPGCGRRARPGRGAGPQARGGGARGPRGLAPGPSFRARLRLPAAPGPQSEGNPRRLCVLIPENR